MGYVNFLEGIHSWRLPFSTKPKKTQEATGPSAIQLRCGYSSPDEVVLGLCEALRDQDGTALFMGNPITGGSILAFLGAPKRAMTISGIYVLPIG